MGRFYENPTPGRYFVTFAVLFAGHAVLGGLGFILHNFIKIIDVDF